MQIKGFIISLVCASVSTALIEGFLPDGTLKKYVRYLLALIMLVVLVSPFRGAIEAIPTIAAASDVYYGEVEALARANSIVAMHIEKALWEKFSLSENEVDAVYENGKIAVSIKKKVGLFESDIALYVKNSFGVETQVSFYD